MIAPTACQSTSRPPASVGAGARRWLSTRSTGHAWARSQAKAAWAAPAAPRPAIKPLDRTVRGNQPCSLGCVQRRAAADPDQTIGAGAPQKPLRLLRRGDRRLARRDRPQRRAAQLTQQVTQRLKLRHRRVGNHRRPADTSSPSPESPATSQPSGAAHAPPRHRRQRASGARRRLARVRAGGSAVAAVACQRGAGGVARPPARARRRRARPRSRAVDAARAVRDSPCARPTIRRSPRPRRRTALPTAPRRSSPVQQTALRRTPPVRRASTRQRRIPPAGRSRQGVIRCVSWSWSALLGGRIGGVGVGGWWAA